MVVVIDFVSPVILGLGEVAPAPSRRTVQGYAGGRALPAAGPAAESSASVPEAQASRMSAMKSR
jgi:hypothetical protein